MHALHGIVIHVPIRRGGIVLTKINIAAETPEVAMGYVHLPIELHCLRMEGAAVCKIKWHEPTATKPHSRKKIFLVEVAGSHAAQAQMQPLQRIVAQTARD